MRPTAGFERPSRGVEAGQVLAMALSKFTATHEPAAEPSAAQGRRFDGWAALCIGVYVLLGLALAWQVPLAKAPDEAAHWEYIEHVATLRSLPVFAGAAPPAPGYEFHQPPLYYILCAPLWAASGAGVQNYWARVASLACGALTVWLVLLSARALFGFAERGERLARRAAMLCALWPLHLAVGASSNNDALGGLFCAALFYRLALLSRRAPTVRDGVWIGVLCGLGLLSKSTTLTVATAAMLGLWHLARRAFASPQQEAQALEPEPAAEPSHPGRRTPQVLAATPGSANLLAEPGRVLGAAAGASLLVCGWLLARNTVLYGDALALGAFSRAATSIGPGLAEFALAGVSAVLYFRNLLVILFASAWGFYGGPNSALESLRPFTHRPAWPGGWLGLAALALMAASTYVLLRVLALGWRGLGRLRSGSGSARDWVWLWWSVGLGLVALAWLQFALAHFAGAQARYLHAALLPVCVLAARAWDDLPRALRLPLGVGLGLVLLGLTLANVLGWQTLV